MFITIPNQISHNSIFSTESTNHPIRQSLIPQFGKHCLPNLLKSYHTNCISHFTMLSLEKPYENERKYIIFYDNSFDIISCRMFYKSCKNGRINTTGTLRSYE